MPVPWVFVLAYLIGVGLQILVPARVIPARLTVPVRIGGGVLFLVGGVVAGWSLLRFQRARTTTVPGEPSIELVTDGPYSFSRNPMYLGLVLAYLGEAGMMVQVWPILTLLLTVAYVRWFVIPVEEESLRAFGEPYERYRARVRRWI